MYLLVLSLITLQCIICSATAQHSAYHPVFEYDVPVAQPIVYTAPPVPTGPYYGSYTVHTTPAVSQTYSQTQTHPIAYVKPVTVFGSSSGRYNVPSAATSRVEHSRLIVPQTNRIYRYQEYPQSIGTQYRKQEPGKNFHEEKRTEQQAYSSVGQNNENQSRAQNDGNVYANRMAYTNNGEQVKLRRYQIHRPGIKKEFYDVEERVIIRPVGSALIELDPPTKKQDITEQKSNGHASNNNQFNSQGFKSNGRTDLSNEYNQNGQYFSTAVPDCGYGYVDQSPVYDYSPPATSFDNPDRQYHPTTFAPATTADNFSPTTVPSQTYLPPYSTDQSLTTRSSSEYSPTTAYSSTPGQYETTTGQYTPTPTTSAASTADSNITPKQSDIYISSTTPVSVTIVDKNEEPNKRQDIIYAAQASSDDNTPDQFQKELHLRGDISQYRAEQSDQFYHELPRSPYTNEPDQPIVYTRSHGEPSLKETIDDADVIEINPHDNSNSTINQNRTSFGNNQQARLIELYTDGKGGISEVGQTENQDQGNRNSKYQDVGNVRARVVSVTPPPASSIPTETINRRRIVVSKPVTTVQEVVEPDNSTTNAQKRNYNNNFSDDTNSRYENNFKTDNGNSNYGTRHNANYPYDNNNQNYDSVAQPTRSNYEEPPSSTGVHISSTPSTASQRIIYVQPVAQNFAQQKAFPPKKLKK